LQDTGYNAIGGRDVTAGEVETVASSKGVDVIGIVIAVLFAALVYAICVALGLPAIVGIVAAILVLLAGIPTGGYGLGGRWGTRA
jgi:hypothetical protein